MTSLHFDADKDDFGTPYKELVTPSQPTPSVIRAWALERGLPVGKRGRIPSDVALAYDLDQASR